ncbi:NYN domain-containing protein [Nocardioides sp. B-3]|uniref:NYN domain-containing protein n=1 Tax=Nocardioides sp. B-3 TaxID=2895565 RepID=UPI002152D7B5|nr:NYN domain-containing protein [Nocardioides sp. B-3]UUZ60489.1 NYN domain-containing protein [Nocardioides sp. B-3]
MESDLHGGTRIAVLIDADNTSAKYAEALLEEVAKYGTPTIKRAYGDFASPQLKGWTTQLNARAIRSMHQTAFTTGKNSTDSALIIDAMDLLYADNVEAFAIVSSDSDFTSLALRLRESGKKVYGLGRKTTPSSLQNACDRFIALEVLMAEGSEGSEESEDKPSDEKTAEEAPSLNLQSALTKAINAMADEDGWVTVSQIGNHLTRTHASFDPRNFGHSKLTALVAAQPYLETRRRREAARGAAQVDAQGCCSQAPGRSEEGSGGEEDREGQTSRGRRAPEAPAAPATPKVTVTTRTRPARKTVPKD